MVESSAPSGFDPVAAARWVERLARFAAGTHTVVAFCAAEGVSESNFYRWRRRLAPAAPRPRPTASPPSSPSGSPHRPRPQILVAVVRGVEGWAC